MYSLAQLYITPSPTEKVFTPDPKEAEKWLIKSAQLNHEPAQFQLGLVYKLGAYRFKRDKEQSCFWLKKAHENGSSMAQSLMRDYC